MGNQWPDPLYQDAGSGNPAFSTAVPISVPTLMAPIPGQSTAYILTQEWMQAQASWAPTALNTAHPSSGDTPDYSSYVLVEESNPRAMGGGLVTWTQTYAQVPSSHSEWESYAYAFIGFAGANWTTTTIPTGRPRQTFTAPSRVQYDYFLVGSGGSYTDPGGIPTLNAQKYRIYAPVAGDVWYQDMDFLTNHPPFNFATVPTRGDWMGYMTNAESLSWSSGTVTYAWGAGGSVTVTHNTSPGQFLVEDSRLTRWRGNIWLRTSRWMLAQ